MRLSNQEEENNKGGQTQEKGNDYRFLRQIDAEYAPELELHLVMDNYGTRNTDQVKRWLKRDPRFKVHFVPTSCSWWDMVERWFAELTGKALRRGSFPSVPDQIVPIEEFLGRSARIPGAGAVESSGR
jgi:DDE superfamily endonuclease